MSEKGQILRRRVLAALKMQYPDSIEKLQLYMRFTSTPQTSINHSLAVLCRDGLAERIAPGLYRFVKENANVD